MAKTDMPEWKSALLTALIAVIPYTIIHQLALVAEKSLNKSAHAMMNGYYTASQPDSFPLIFLFVLFFGIFAVSWVYALIAPRLPGNWMIHGALIGIFLFFINVLPFSVQTGYTTAMPAVVAKWTAIFGLLAGIVNGGVITYIYARVSKQESKKKEK